jgi:hypothetical protein
MGVCLYRDPQFDCHSINDWTVGAALKLGFWIDVVDHHKKYSNTPTLFRYIYTKIQIVNNSNQFLFYCLALSFTPLFFCVSQRYKMQSTYKRQ